MKFPIQWTLFRWDLSHPARGAWIEIRDLWDQVQHLLSHPARGAWIEILIRR